MTEITLHPVTHKEEKNLGDLIDLYESAFPKRERRDREALKEMIGSRKNMNLFSIQREKELAGFIIAWELDGFTFIEHFAIFDQMRGGGIGKAVIDKVSEQFPGTIILEVEPLKSREPQERQESQKEADITKRRIEFYRRAGFEIITKEYIQPPYREEDLPAQLWLMSNTPGLTAYQIEQFIKTIHTVIYESARLPRL